MNLHSLFKQWVEVDRLALDSLFFIWYDHVRDRHHLTHSQIEIILREK
jgi:hypothetical protein